MKYTTAKQDAALMLHLYAEATKRRQIGDRVLAKGGGETTIAAIDGDLASLANGEQWHVSKLRSAPPFVRIDESTILVDLRDAPAWANKARMVQEIAEKHLSASARRFTYHTASQEETLNIWLVSRRKLSAEEALKIAKRHVSAKLPKADLSRSAPKAAPKIRLSEVEISTRDYEFAYGHAPRGRGSWAFFFADDLRTPWFAPGSLLYSQACKQARAEAQRRGVDSASVGT